jgi:hypothetical protein
MNRLRFAVLAVGALSLGPSLLAETDVARSVVMRQSRVTTTPGLRPSALRSDCPSVGLLPECFTVEVPVLARVQGSAFFRTLIAITNNTSKNGVRAHYQFSYTCVAAACSPAGGFYRTTPVQIITLPALGSFVQDDFIDYLNTLGLLQPGAEQGAIGTLLVSFDNLPTSNGYEANVVARTYNRLVEADANQGTVGFAYNASEFFDSADTTLVGFARDTKAAPTIAGKLRSNIGIRNTDINGTDQNMTVDITFYDTATGTKVGSTITFADLRPGEVRQVSDVWATAGISSTVNSVIVFADARNPTATSPTMEGYITIIEGQNTQDAALFTMLCADANGCGN